MRLSQLDPSAPDHAEKVAKLQAEKQAYQLAECQKRAERFPTDLQIRFELGQLYFQIGQDHRGHEGVSEGPGQPAPAHSALSYLAQCFAGGASTTSPPRTFQDAIKEKLVFDEEKKELIYLLGCVFEKHGQAGRGDRAVQADLRRGRRLQGRAREIDAFYAGG